MKSLRYLLFALLICLPTGAFSQSDAQKALERLKTLAGSWAGTYEGMPMVATIRVTYTGNAIMHEMTGAERPDDDENHPLTVLYLEGDRLLLTHYCDVGNRPRMVGKMAPDGKTVEFSFLDIANYRSDAGLAHGPRRVHHARPEPSYGGVDCCTRGETANRFALGSPPHEMRISIL